MEYKIIFFYTSRSDSPVYDFIKKQDLKSRTKISQYVRLLSEYGPNLKPPYMKKIQNQLFELRITGRISIRIFYSPIRREYCLLHAFKKKTQKTPKKEIKIALDRLKLMI